MVDTMNRTEVIVVGAVLVLSATSIIAMFVMMM